MSARQTSEITAAQIALIKPIAAHTPGPWRWDVNPKSRSIRLEQAKGMGSTVLIFDRWGMTGATPSFRDDYGIMQPAHLFSKVFPNREHHADWARFLDHPDARLIEAAPDLLECLEEWIAPLLAHPHEECNFSAVSWKAFVKARAAIAKARGEADHA